MVLGHGDLIQCSAAAVTSTPCHAAHPPMAHIMIIHIIHILVITIIIIIIIIIILIIIVIIMITMIIGLMIIRMMIIICHRAAAHGSGRTPECSRSYCVYRLYEEFTRLAETKLAQIP